MSNIEDNAEIIKKPRGRPRKTEEEKKENRRKYEKVYQKKRYDNDEEYRRIKKAKSVNYYRKKIGLDG
jgi:hypothetical protein